MSGLQRNAVSVVSDKTFRLLLSNRPAVSHESFFPHLTIKAPTQTWYVVVVDHSPNRPLINQFESPFFFARHMVVVNNPDVVIDGVCNCFKMHLN